MLKNITMISFITLLFSGCIGGEVKESWSALIYPSKDNLKKNMHLGDFATLDECKTSAQKKLNSLNLADVGDYRCGLNCGYNNNLQMVVCERLEK